VLERPGEASTEQPLDPEGIKGLSLSGSPSARSTAPASSDGLAPAAGPAAVPAAAARPPSERPPSSTDISLILARGDSLFGVGDIASARLFYERVADAGDGQAALRLGETYDPAFLERAQLRVQGDRAQGVFWYRRARDLGASEAEILLKGAQVR
jgi:TPR repeat protein